MRSSTRPGIVLAIAVAVVALPTIASGALSGASTLAAAASNTTSYQDSSGENPAAPDITTLTVSNNDVSVISFKINIPNRPQLTQDMLFLLFADTDANPQTGDPESLGADYVIQVFGGEAALFRWDGSDFTRRAGDPPATSLIFAYQSGLTITISAAELGNTKRFGFAAIVIGGVAIDPVTSDLDFTNSVSDVAPAAGAGLYQYEVKITPPTLVVRKLAPTPAKPTAGKAFTLRLVAARSDTGAVVQNGKVSCVGRVGNARLKAQVQRVVAGAATCTWKIPAKAKRKTFRGSVAVVFEGLKASQGYASKVR
ncbi:MAG: hypothetical protein OEW52_09120 [Thermoleophilia bacterium]|nr:hypothetical protein [Thermoleophilia bacterium]MDH4341019.1 hypothetical protein [Thermoleophilia bacterium]MDH5281292.1 hypothetical protein [Thermoleophilia bacterium]